MRYTESLTAVGTSGRRNLVVAFAAGRHDTPVMLMRDAWGRFREAIGDYPQDGA